MVINNDCSYDGRYNDILSIKKRNEFKCRRLVIQKMIIEDKDIYDRKDYMFFPIKSSNSAIVFDYKIGTNMQFGINFEKSDTIIVCNKEKLKQEEIFEQNYPQLKTELQNEKQKYLDKCKEKRGLRIKKKVKLNLKEIVKKK